ncbi:hypothetical protein Tco_0988242 [Tanacetum coccineum]|uniref:Uncharacterized protein n=1 Tax=Tanacetum coccineum TaxID=301880 RepID=A0ABQ5EQG7_9ASTR
MDTGSTSTDNLIESLTNTLSLLNQSFKTHLPQTNNQLRTSSNARNNATVQDVVVQDVRGRYNANNQGRPFQRNNARGNVVAGNAGGDSDYFKDKMLLMNAHENGAVLDEEQLLFLTGEQVTNFDDDVFEADQCDAFDSDVDEAPTTQTMFMNLIVNCLSTQLLYDVEKSRCLDLEADMSKVHDESKLISKLEGECLNLQLKYQHLQESFDNKKSQASQEAPDFNSFFKIKNLEHQIQEKDNVIRDLKVLVSNVNDRSCEPYNANDVTDLLEQNERLRAEIEKVKQHYKEMFESIKITRTSTNAKTSSLLTQIEDLKAQLEGNLKVATRSSVKPKVLAPGMYAIDVKPIPHPLKNNRSAHLNYISHLKESVETVREIVEEARVVKPLDNALNYACQYTKLSQELLEYVIGTCPKSFSERDNKNFI